MKPWLLETVTMTQLKLCCAVWMTTATSMRPVVKPWLSVVMSPEA